MAAKTKTKTTKVKGGVIGRSAKTGRFISVTTYAGRKLASAKTQTVVKEISSKRRSALQRLADR